MMEMMYFVTESSKILAFLFLKFLIFFVLLFLTYEAKNLPINLLYTISNKLKNKLIKKSLIRHMGLLTAVLANPYWTFLT